jgi:sugar phosphate isomerase/epimerase
MILGIRAHDFGKLSVEELAEKISAKGLRCTQLALSKAVAGIQAGPGFLASELANQIREAFARKNVQIAVLGCYINPIHPDPAERRNQIALFKEHLRYVREFGCSMVATETGHVEPHERESAFRILTDTVKELVSEAEKFDAVVGIEGGGQDTIGSPEWMKRLLDSIPSDHLQVVFDPVNLIPEEDYHRQDEMMRKAFDLFGDRIAAIHAKDFKMENNRIKVIDTIGDGLLNYDLLLKLVKTRKNPIPVSMESTRPETVDRSIRFIRDLYRQC